MRSRRLLVLFGTIPAFILVICCAHAQSFAIAAVPVATASGATGSIQYTVSGIPFDGDLAVSCQYAGSSSYQAQAKLPVCGVGPPFAISVTTGQTVAGAMGLAPWGAPEPAALQGTPAGARLAPAPGLVLAGALLFAAGFRRRGRCRLSLFMIAAVALGAALGASACGGSSNGSVPGIYPYTMTATDNSNSPAILSAATSTTVYVTVQ